MDAIVIIYAIVFTILGLILYHSIFEIWYFNLSKALIGELIGGLIFGVIMTALTLKFWYISCIIIIILGISLSIKVSNPTGKKIVVVFFLLVAIITAVLGINYKKPKSVDRDTYEIDASSVSKDFLSVKKGDIIVFGEYEQDNDLSNGPEPLEWIVLSKNDSELLVLSKYAIDCRAFYEDENDYTWEKSSIRQWLNNDFISSAFKNGEIDYINETLVSGKYTKLRDADENDTMDRIFLLSTEDMNNTEYGFSENWHKKDINRRCSPTAYAVAHGAQEKDDKYKTENEENTCDWWLRTVGYYKSNHASVNHYGEVLVDAIAYETNAIRPAMTIKIQ